VFSFKAVRLPFDSLLDRFTRIDPTTGYSSEISKPQELFAKFTDALLSGRLVVAACSTVVAKNALVPTLRYAVTRKIAQRKGPAMPLLAFSSHRRALVPRLSQCLAMCMGVNSIKLAFAGHTRKHFRPDGGLFDVAAASQDTDELSLVVCALKAYNCQQAGQIVSVCRDCCGGQGVLAGNRLGEYSNVLVTLQVAEGDLVLLQQKTSRSLLMSLMGGDAPSEPPLPELVITPGVAPDLSALATLIRLREVVTLNQLGGKLMELQGKGLKMMEA